MNHVTQVVGGVLSQQKHIGQHGRAVHDGAEGAAGGGRAVPADQRVPDAGVSRASRTCCGAWSRPASINRVRNAQNSVMNSLLQPARLDRMVEQAALEPGGVRADRVS